MSLEASVQSPTSSAIVMRWARGAAAPGTPPSFEWREAGVRHRGWGEAWSVELRGRARLVQLRDALAALWSRVEVMGDAPPIAPRVYGGLAFAPGGADAPPWTAFGDGRFALPRISELTLPDGGTWTCRVTDEALPAIHVREGGAVRPLRSEASYTEAVAAIQADIARGTLDKVVLARRACLPLSAHAEPGAIVERLALTFADCTTFAFTSGGATFLGATPERLFTKRGRRVATEALAGSIDARTADAAARLAASDKDRAEHAFVVDDIVRRMTPLCASLEVAAEPAIRALPNVLHLRTPIDARLHEGIGAVDLIEALHPTPAVGGVPAEAALERIAALEPDARGWYSGPVGWIDARGDAELCVALRSGVLAGDRAYLYAGAGIVEGSSPEAEWAETELKMRALASALGACP